MPGRIIQGLKMAGVKNPVILLDEVDKLVSGGVHGDPIAALLEVLDPHQNSKFVDHYLNIPFDLSQVLFMATANSMSKVCRPLKDRMEVIQVEGYTVEEKVPIAIRHLLPKLVKNHGLDSSKIYLSEDILKFISK